MKALDYEILVPGHGPVQRDTDYIDLLIEAAESIADQRDRMLADGKRAEEVEAALDFSAFEEKFTHGDDFVRVAFENWFEQPFRAAAMKALTGEPMVEVSQPEPVPFDDERWTIEGNEAEQVEYLGAQALRLKGASAVLEETDIPNGLVEFERRGFRSSRFRRARVPVAGRAELRTLLYTATPVRQPGREPVHAGLRRRQRLAALLR